MENLLILLFMLFFIIVMIVITWVTTRTTRSASDFYVAGNKASWIQTGIAMIGSYISAASFLGISGDISIFGVDRIWLAIGFFSSYMAVLLLIAGPLCNVGSFTVADVLYRRFPNKEIKLLMMISTLIISTFYLVPQMLGIGLLFEFIFGWNFVLVTVILGAIICIYVLFGGMRATLYNQVVQAIFLFGVMVFITVFSFMMYYDFSLIKLFEVASYIVPPSIAGSDPAVAAAVSIAPNAAAGIDIARQMLPTAPNAMTTGVQNTNILTQISMVVALIFGTAGLPHILIMFYTVPSAKAAKKSIMLCVVGLGIFYICTIILGFMLMPQNYPTLVSWIAEGNMSFAKNMSVFEGAKVIGGQLLIALTAAGAVAAVLSTAAGLLITSASTVSHDLYKVYIKINATEKQELLIAKITTVFMSIFSIVFAILLKNENIAWLVTLSFGIAASAIFPALLSNLWWKRYTKQGAIAGIISGLLVSLLFVVLLLSGKTSFLGLPTSGGPGIFGVTVSILVIIVTSLLTKDTGKDVEAFFALAHKPDSD